MCLGVRACMCVCLSLVMCVCLSPVMCVCLSLVVCVCLSLVCRFDLACDKPHTTSMWCGSGYVSAFAAHLVDSHASLEEKYLFLGK
jgi:hypothetical protein